MMGQSGNRWPFVVNNACRCQPPWRMLLRAPQPNRATAMTTLATWDCTSCSARNPVPTFYQKPQWSGGTPTSIRCPRCGDAHRFADGEAHERIGPLLIPFHPVYRASPWRDSTTRPAKPGAYLCRFNTLQHPILLAWDGRHFRDRDSRPVRTDGLVGWRGSWSNT